MEDSISVVVEHLHHPWLEWASWGAQIVLLAVAMVAAWLARNQLKEMSDFRTQRVRILNATLLMELDNRWDSPNMQDSRRQFQNAFEQVTAAVVTSHPRANDKDRIEQIRLEWIKRLSDKRASSRQEYSEIMAIPGFFETVGLMVDRKYIESKDVFELFGGPIVDLGLCFKGHIIDLQRESGVPKGMYEHALNLSALAEKVISR